jgi:hypothetical protein
MAREILKRWEDLKNMLGKWGEKQIFVMEK